MGTITPNSLLPLLFLSILLAGSAVEALSYDYSATMECLAEPHKAQYGGGVLVNAEFNEGLRGWSIFGNAHVQKKRSKGGNNFIAAHGRKQPYGSFSQEVYLQKDMIYSFSAWVQMGDGNGEVRGVVKTKNGYSHAAAVVAQSGCWSMMKGGFSSNTSGHAHLYFESNNTRAEIWVDNVSLQPFTHHEWRSHRQESIQKVRKRTIHFHAVDAEGNNLAGANISVSLVTARFPFGCAMNKNIMMNTAYQNWFTSRFSVTTFEDEMKWYSTEATQGREDYSVPDAMLAFAKKHGISVRGHNVLWDDSRFQPRWVYSLSPDRLKSAATKRVQSVVSRYAGQLIGWDVVNENLHFNFFESKLGRGTSKGIYQQAHKLDPKTTMFLNDYNTLEEKHDSAVWPAKYLDMVRRIQAQGATGIGLEGHFNKPDVAYIRSSLDTLASAKLPIWITEVDVQPDPNQAKYLEEILREAHSHPAVQGIVVWSAWKPQGCYRMCLTDNNFKNLPTGDVVDKLIKEWRTMRLEGFTDTNGSLEISVPHGDYEVTVSHPAVSSSFTRTTMKVETTDTLEEKNLLLHFTLPA